MDPQKMKGVYRLLAKLAERNLIQMSLRPDPNVTESAKINENTQINAWTGLEPVVLLKNVTMVFGK